MDTVFEQFKSMWSKSIITSPLDKNVQIFHRAKLNTNLFHDMIDYLKDEFYNSKQNVFLMHLFLVEQCLDSSYDSNHMHKVASASLINYAFVEWRNQIKNLNKKKNTEHLTSTCKEDVCNCRIDALIITDAFKLVVKKNINMLSSFNKIYNFTDNYHLLQAITTTHIQKLHYSDQAALIGELQVQDKFNIEHIIIPLMLLDKYTSIDEFINKDSKTMLSVIDICDMLCNSETNLKEISLRYPELRSRKLEKFKSKAIAKYASNCLKKNKKLYLIATKYVNIAFQLKLSQMRFLVNLKYDKMTSDPISLEAWCELLLDLIGNDDKLQYKLLLELIQYQKDVEIAHRFLVLFGYDKLFNKLSESHKEFIDKNLPIIHNENTTYKEVNKKEKYYYPEDLLNDANIKFVDNEEYFIEMLNYFETAKPNAIGLDCEWKPSFDLIDNSNEDEQNEKRNRASTFQIATKERCFILDMKYLIDTLDESHINRFGDLILFNEGLLKFGYSFQQDSKKLSSSFPKFRHRFCEFEDDVINIDEVVANIQKKSDLFTDDSMEPKVKSSQKQPKGLSELTRKCFGKPLNKSECISNWDSRPLRHAQLKYAALDAFVLLQIHDFIQERSKLLDVNFDYTSKKMCF